MLEPAMASRFRGVRELGAPMVFLVDSMTVVFFLDVQEEDDVLKSAAAAAALMFAEMTIVGSLYIAITLIVFVRADTGGLGRSGFIEVFMTQAGPGVLFKTVVRKSTRLYIFFK